MKKADVTTLINYGDKSDDKILTTTFSNPGTDHQANGDDSKNTVSIKSRGSSSDKRNATITISSSGTIAKVVLSYTNPDRELTSSGAVISKADNKKTFTYSGRPSTITIVNSEGNFIITKIEITYSAPVYTANTCPYTWDFKNNDWTSSIAQLAANTTEWTLRSETTAVYDSKTNSISADNGIDMITGLSFTGYRCLDAEACHIYMASDATVTIPDLKANYRVTFTLSDETVISAPTGTTSTGNNVFLVNSDGAKTFTAPKGIWIHSIKIEEVYAAYETTKDDGFHFTGKGKLLGGTVITDEPGVTITIGAEGDSWSVHGDRTTYAGGVASSSTVPAVDDRGLPSHGTFYKFEPVVNGYLLIDYYAWGNNDYYLLEVDANTQKVVKTFRPQGSNSTDVTGYWIGESASGGTVPTNSSMPLRAGKTYYLYCKTSYIKDSYTTNYAMYLHRVKFAPSYLMANESNVLVNYDDSEVAITVGEDYELPFILAKTADNVSFTGKKVSDGSELKVDDDGSFFIPTSQAGQIYQITCNVKSPTSDIVESPSLKVKVVANPKVYLVDESYDTEHEKKVEDTSYMLWGSDMDGNNAKGIVTSVEGITMRYGGWKYNSGQYDEEGGSGGTTYQDKWGSPRADAARIGPDGRPSRSIQGFERVSSGYRDATAEYLKEAKTVAGFASATRGFYDQQNPSTHGLPCRGAYVVFEPTKNGTLSVYTLQNGCVDTYQKDTQSKYKSGYTIHDGSPTGYVTWRPYFITDESGKFVEVDDDKRVAKNVIRYTLQQVTDSVAKYGTDEKTVGTSIYHREVMTDAHKTYIKDPEQWPTTITDNDGNLNTISQVLRVPNNLGGGYMVLQKGYVKYEFPVKAGKSYFFFSNYSKLGLCGFKFEPKGDTPVAVTFENSQDSYSGSEQYANVTLKRTFTAGTWTSICLPFSVSTSQFKQIFANAGDLLNETAHLIECTGVEGKTAKFKNHVYNQMLVAGVPYFIKTTKTVTNPFFENVTIENVAAKNNESTDYVFKGVYASESMPAGSYFINDKLYNITKPKASASWRAYFAPRENSGSAKIASFSFDDAFEEYIGEDNQIGIATEIELNTISSLSNTFDVYTADGTKVRSNTDSLEKLPKGVYVVNGKKYVVR